MSRFKADLVTEDAAAQHFAKLYGAFRKYCHDTGAWFLWNQVAWRQDQTGLVFEESRVVARQLTRAEPAKVRYVSCKTSFAAGIERFARSDPVFAVTAEVWDADPFLLGTPGGTVDLRTGRLRPSDPAEGITKLTAVAPAETADCRLWRAFLEEATGGDTALIRFLQQWAGYCLTGDTREHALVFVCGPGGNGKSVLINVIMGILHEYAVTAAMETFTASKSDRHPTDLAMLRGRRLVTASESEEGRAWAESRIKQMTGGDPITARFMRQDFFTFCPQFKLIIIGNHKPVLHCVDDAARRRFNIVPFTRTPASPDPLLEEKLKTEWPGIFRWMIEGCLDWQAHRLIRPASVVDATEDYFSAQDIFGQWLDEKCDAEPGNGYKTESNATLYASWREYAEKAGEPAGSQKAFAEQMQRRGLQRYRNSAGRGFSGIRLKSPHRSYHDT